MANREHLARLCEGGWRWNPWREENSDVIPDLSGLNIGGSDMEERSAIILHAGLRYCNLNGVDLRGAQLTQEDLRGVHLSGAGLMDADLGGSDLSASDLSQAVLIDAYLGFADFTEANLRSCNADTADFTGAKLVHADLSDATLQNANLSDADLAGSDFTDASVGYTVFGNNDLSNVKGLETLEHSGPSTVGIDTIYRSKGKIPELFLRGCGVPEEFITFANSLATNPIEFYSCFISYSTKDQDFADRLYADLQNKSVRCWFAPHDVQGGKKLHEQIDEAIRLHDKLLLILSPHSMASEWVKTEIAKARKREVRDQRRVLFPIRLAPFETLRDWECFDADTGKDSAREIREYFIPDFSNWKNHDSYQEAFTALIRDLKASDPIRK